MSKLCPNFTTLTPLFYVKTFQTNNRRTQHPLMNFYFVNRTISNPVRWNTCVRRVLIFIILSLEIKCCKVGILEIRYQETSKPNNRETNKLWNRKTPKPTHFETKKPRHQETKKSTNQWPTKTRGQETKNPPAPQHTDSSQTKPLLSPMEPYCWHLLNHLYSKYSK